MQWNVQGVKPELKTGLTEFLKYWGISEDISGIQIKIAEGECLSVKNTADRYSVTYRDNAEMFRGLALLRGNLAEGNNEINICEKRQLDTCGVMIDCSRNAVPKVSKMKEIFCKLACVGINRCMLYTEDTYKMEDYPYFGYMRGAYTAEELKELDYYAYSFGIELIPCIQTLGHLRQALRWSYANNIKDTDDILLIGCDETYRFIESMFKTCRECFRSPNIHIGMDEAHTVGLGNYLKKNGYKDRVSIMLEHLKKVCDIADKYEFSPMMWSDMFFRLCSDKGDYYDAEKELPKEIIDQMPENISLVFWDYYHEDKEVYDRMYKRHSEVGKHTVFAGGIWIWAGLGVNYKKTFETTYPALKSTKKYGIKDVFATIWGDDGAEIPFDETWLGIQLYGEYIYHDEVSDEHLKNRFKQCLGYDADSFRALQIDDYPQEWCCGDAMAVSKNVLYQDVLLGLFDKNYEDIPLKEHYIKHKEKLENAVVPKDLKNLFEYQKQLLDVLILKCDMGIRIYDAYKNKESLEGCIYDLQKLEWMIAKLQCLFTKIWESNNKIFGLERIDLRLSGVTGRIRTAIRRLEGYTKGEYDKLEELEFERLAYDENASKGKSLMSVNHYDLVASVSSKGMI